MPISKQEILKSAISRPVVNPTIKTNTPKNAAGELINPTAKDVSDFNAKHTTIRKQPQPGMSTMPKLVPGPSGTAGDLIKRTNESAKKDMAARELRMKDQFKNLAQKPVMPYKLTPPSVRPTSPKMNTLKKAINGAS